VALNVRGFLACLLVIGGVVCGGPVSAGSGDGDWRRFREVHVPENIQDGPVGIALESSVIENCRPDLADIRIGSSDGSPVPFFVTSATVGQDPEPFPANVFKVIRKPGKWTDIWVDKTGKVLTRGVRIQTSSKNFVKNVELRGSDSIRESYVIRMDGLIADIGSPVPLRSLDIFHPLNSFQYIHVRILDQEDLPLNVEGVLCHPPESETGTSRPMPVIILENRTVNREAATSMLVDFGEKRFPLTRLCVTTPAPEFRKRATLFGASSPNPPSWSKFFETTFFRLRREEAAKEHLCARMQPQPYRYVRIELSGGKDSAVALDGVKAQGEFRMAVFRYGRDATYRLYYDNPKAESAGGEPFSSSIDVRQLAQLSQSVSLGPEQKIVGPARSLKAKQPKQQVVSSLWKIGGVLVLLVGLVLLFSLMLRERSLRRMERRNRVRLLDERWHRD
jgi:hypothetical protein